jgi:hypothetical protein
LLMLKSDIFISCFIFFHIFCSYLLSCVDFQGVPVFPVTIAPRIRTRWAKVEATDLQNFQSSWDDDHCPQLSPLHIDTKNGSDSFRKIDSALFQWIFSDCHFDYFAWFPGSTTLQPELCQQIFRTWSEALWSSYCSYKSTHVYKL